jgi:hypothetical protein
MKIPAPPLSLVSDHEDDDAILLTDEVSQLDHDDDTILLTDEISLSDHEDDIILLTDEAPLSDDDDIILLTDEAPLADHDDNALLQTDNALLTHHKDEDMVDFGDVAFQRQEISQDAKDETDVIDLSDVIEPEDTVTDFFELEFSEKPADAPIAEQPEDSIENLLLELDSPIVPPVTAPDPIGEDISERADFALELPQTSPDEDLILQQSSLLLETPPVSDAENNMIESLDISIDHPGEVSLSPPIQPDRAESRDKFDDLQNMFNEIIQDSHLPPIASPAESSPETGISGNTPNASEPQFPEIAVTEQQITAVVKRVLQNIVSEKIEDMLKSLLTEAVAHEMDTMKSNLLEYLGTARIRNPD